MCIESESRARKCGKESTLCANQGECDGREKRCCLRHAEHVQFRSNWDMYAIFQAKLPDIAEVGGWLQGWWVLKVAGGRYWVVGGGGSLKVAGGRW